MIEFLTIWIVFTIIFAIIFGKKEEVEDWTMYADDYRP